MPDLQPHTVKVFKPAAKANNATASSAWQPAYVASTAQAPVIHKPMNVFSFLMCKVDMIPLDLIWSVAQDAPTHTQPTGEGSTTRLTSH